MKRRYFLLSGLAGICGLFGLRYASSSDESAIIKVLHKKLSYLKLDDAGVRRFAHDQAMQHSISSARLRTIDAAGPLYTRLNLSADNKVDNAIHHGEDRVVTQYLISSDFFKNGADQNRTVHYYAYYDALIACSNPFARPATDPTPA